MASYRGYTSTFPGRVRTDYRTKVGGKWQLKPEFAQATGVTLDLTPIMNMLGILPDQALWAASKGLFKAASYDIGQETLKQVPRRFEVLANSYHVKPPTVEGTQVSVVFGYGGNAIEYALHVHEDLTARHRAPTKAKYLEDPVRSMGRDSIVRWIEAEMKRAI